MGSRTGETVAAQLNELRLALEAYPRLKAALPVADVAAALADKDAEIEALRQALWHSAETNCRLEEELALTSETTEMVGRKLDSALATLRHERAQLADEVAELERAVARAQAERDRAAAALDEARSDNAATEALRARLTRLQLELERAGLCAAQDARQRENAIAILRRRAERDRSRNELMLNFAHGLRQRAATLQQLIGRRAESGLAERGVLDAAIERVTTAITGLAEDFLDLQLIESNKLGLGCGELDLAELVRETALLVFDDPPELEVDGAGLLPPIYGDRARLFQIVGNILSVCGTSSDPPALRARASEDEVWLEITLSPSAPGRDDDLSGERLSHNIGAASALGLALARRLLATLGGHLSIIGSAPQRLRVALPIAGEAVLPSNQLPRLRSA